MKKNIEITGEIAEVIESYVGIRLHICSDIKDFFAVDTEEKEIITRLNATTRILLNIEHTYKDYVKLIADLGISVPELSLTHWTPEKYSKVYVIVGNEIIGQVSGDRAEIKKACLSYNVFPRLALAERAINLSKLDRLILLWQYKNNCLFTPDWKKVDQLKYSVSYYELYKELRTDTIYAVREHKTYFETIEQAEKFISVYDKEIKKIMGVE